MLDVRARMRQDSLENGSYRYMNRFGEVQPLLFPDRVPDLETDTCGFATAGAGSRLCREGIGPAGTDWEAVASVTVPMVLVVYAGVATTAEETASRMVAVEPQLRASSVLRVRAGFPCAPSGGVSIAAVRRISDIVQASFTFAPSG
jgi:hypothetical protein